MAKTQAHTWVYAAAAAASWAARSAFCKGIGATAGSVGMSVLHGRNSNQIIAPPPPHQCELGGDGILAGHFFGVHGQA